ncbi:hypothetical protein E2C01_092590 [Portunus trituberculatus]|uniref:Uncharacterized protein n=1 Tax=Portunus trituberculatus TaxID=210409 RepID=A0A5B7JRT4_PORTR|nr:hypothetical protein [Portunus trituberculatus]
MRGEGKGGTGERLRPSRGQVTPVAGMWDVACLSHASPVPPASRSPHSRRGSHLKAAPHAPPLLASSSSADRAKRVPRAALTPSLSLACRSSCCSTAEVPLRRQVLVEVGAIVLKGRSCWSLWHQVDHCVAGC